MEIIQLIETSTNDLSKVESIIEWAFRELEVPDDDAIIYITDDHNKVRETLGLEKAAHEEWPVKYIDAEGQAVISVIPSKLLQLREDEVRIMVLREVALIRVMNDPVLISMWVASQGISDNAVHRVSLAMLRRTVDFVIARQDSLVQFLVNTFNKDELRNMLNTCQLTVDCAITALALDVPLSIELVGNAGLGKSLWNNVVMGLSNDFVRRYDDFRDFVRNNFNVENAYNYLLMMFRRS
ncbi:hypothetical protein [Vulcanisaeta sp. JCM 14467]|uniref:hypothetical protein n=1 Tax=Vulcanisaeta sp. JCM 14467 TaxID=1295370 RepID=UPI0006D29AAA|nr:hypothetical protein [Vulcanisaeta sp. JCM 14467]